MNQNLKIFNGSTHRWLLSATLGGYLFGFNNAVISDMEQTFQKLWNLNAFEHDSTHFNFPPLNIN